MAHHKRNIFVVALDDFQRRELATIHSPHRYEFHSLLGYEDVIHRDEYPMDEILAKARRQLDAFDGDIHAIIGHWDFPTTALVPILCEERGLRAPPLAAVVRCEHKYWARVVQQQVIPELTPRFGKVDPFDEHALDRLELDFPFWVKPIKAYSSHLGFKIHDRREFEEAMEQVRAEIHRFADPFNVVLERIDMPPEISGVDATYCIAEEYMSGIEIAHEGHVFESHARIHGTIDMLRENETFLGYAYPSEMPAAILERMNEAGLRLIRHLGFDNGCFNAEYFWNPDTDELKIIEVNPRMSQSHSFLFHTVDGASDHELLIDIALGQTPHFPHRRGKYAKAAKMFIRSFGDGIVRRVPSPRAIAAARNEVPDSFVELVVEPGQLLSDLADQDSYSFELAELYVPAQSHDELLRRYDRLVELLEFEIETEAEARDEPAPLPLGREASP